MGTGSFCRISAAIRLISWVDGLSKRTMMFPSLWNLHDNVFHALSYRFSLYALQNGVEGQKMRLAGGVRKLTETARDGMGVLLTCCHLGWSRQASYVL